MLDLTPYFRSAGSLRGGCWAVPPAPAAASSTGTSMAFNLFLLRWQGGPLALLRSVVIAFSPHSPSLQIERWCLHGRQDGSPPAGRPVPEAAPLPPGAVRPDNVDNTSPLAGPAVPLVALLELLGSLPPSVPGHGIHVCPKIMDQGNMFLLLLFCF